MALRVEEVHAVFEGLLSAIRRLVRQLSATAPELTEPELREIVDSEASRLLIARNDGAIVGTLTLVLFRIPTGVRAWIEDVVVDEDMRGQGVGKALTNAAIQVARENRARTVDLTSRPAREDANRLYQKIGFRHRETVVYRIDTSLTGL